MTASDARSARRGPVKGSASPLRWAPLALALWALGCPARPVATSEAGSGEGAAAAVASGEGSAPTVGVAPGPGSGAAEPVVEVPPVAVAPLPAAIARQTADAAGFFGTAGGALTADALEVSVPPGALEAGVSLSLKALAVPTQLTFVPTDRSLIVGVASVLPWNPGLVRAAQVTVPLTHRVEPGMPLELLGWQPSMRSYLVIATAPASADGASATFSVRQFGEMYVRAAPVVRDGGQERCAGAAVGFRRAWPSQDEDAIVGLVEQWMRIDRATAFNVLSDYRLHEGFGRIEFKNEELRENTGTRRRELEHRDEDFLMDPNVAAALSVLARLIEAEWVDPLSGQPAFRLRITEAFDALIEHSPRSTHYEGRAADITLSPVPAANGDERRARYGRVSRLAVCSGFDYVLFENEFHVHASVAASEVALLVDDPTTGMHVRTARIGQLDRWTRSQTVVPPGAVDLRWDARGEFAFNPPSSLLTLDGLRRLVVNHGRAYLANPTPVPPPGSAHADGDAVDVVYPWPIAPVGPTRVRAASWLLHRRTAEALRTYRTLP